MATNYTSEEEMYCISYDVILVCGVGGGFNTNYTMYIILY